MKKLFCGFAVFPLSQDVTPDSFASCFSSWGDFASLLRFLFRGFAVSPLTGSNACPSMEKSLEFIIKMVEAGCGLIEIGIPFSDPVAEGPVIHVLLFFLGRLLRR